MAKKLTKQEIKYVELKAETGNGTLAAKEAFGIKDDNYAAVKSSRLLRNDNIKDAIDEALPNNILLEVHREGLYATREYYNSKGEMQGDVADFAIRAKYLDMGYKLKGSYAAEKHANINVNLNVEDDKALEEAAKAYGTASLKRKIS